MSKNEMLTFCFQLDIWSPYTYF